MELYFVRHGRAEDREAWAPRDDNLRPLTEDGARRMQQTARTLAALRIQPDAILTSPWTRARQTADILAVALGVAVTEDPALAEFGVGALATLVEQYATAGRLLLVGHEPDFSIVIGQIIGGGQVEVKKGSLIRVDLFALRPPHGILAWAIPPAVLTVR